MGFVRTIRFAAVWIAVLSIAACARQGGEGGGTTGPAPGTAGPGASGVPAQGEPPETILRFRFRVPAGESAPVYESMRPDSPVAFYARDGVEGILRSSTTFLRDGTEYTYWRIESGDGEGWVFDGFVTDIHKDVPNPPPGPATGVREPGGAPGPSSPGEGSSLIPVINAKDPGEPVALTRFVVPGKWTVFDFYSEYCGPCRLLAPRLEALARRRADVAVRKVDINRPGRRGIDWESPAVRAFDLKGIPYLKIYGPEGRLEAEGDEAMMLLERLMQGS